MRAGRTARKRVTGGKAPLQVRRPFLFAAAATFSALEARLARGERLKTTALTEEFSYERYQAQQREQDRLPLFAVAPDGRPLPFTDPPDFTPRPGWKIVAMTAGAEASPSSAPENGPGQ